MAYCAFARDPSSLSVREIDSSQQLYSSTVVQGSMSMWKPVEDPAVFVACHVRCVDLATFRVIAHRLAGAAGSCELKPNKRARKTLLTCRFNTTASRAEQSNRQHRFLPPFDITYNTTVLPSSQIHEHASPRHSQPHNRQLAAVQSK